MVLSKDAAQKLSKRLAEIRDFITQAEFFSRSGLSQKTIWNILNRKKVRADSIKRFLTALEETESELEAQKTEINNRLHKPISEVEIVNQ